MATTQLFSAARGLARRRAVGSSVIKRRVVTESQVCSELKLTSFYSTCLVQGSRSGSRGVERRLALRRFCIPGKVWSMGVSLSFASSINVVLIFKSVRSYLGLLQEDTLLDRLKEIFDSVHTHGFKVLKLEPRMKDGGVFARYSFQSSANEDALDDILRDLKSEGAKRGGFPSWLRMLHGNIWPVKGQPWREVRYTDVFEIAFTMSTYQDLHRFASPMLKISFEGPDIREEELYDLLRVSLAIKYRDNRS